MKFFFLSLILILTVGWNPVALSQEASLTQAQVQFDQALKSGQYAKALALWEEAFSSKDFRESSTGQALKAFLLYKMGMKVTAIENLFAISKPDNISESVRDKWTQELNSKSDVWETSYVFWNPKFNGIFGAAIKNKLTVLHMYGLKNQSEINNAKTLLDAFPKASSDAAWVRWQLALALGLKNKTSEASRYLQELLDSKQTMIGEDEILLTAARLLYQDSKVDSAMKYYDMVSKNSDHWVQAVEEKAWVYTRKGDYERGLGQLQNLMTSLFTPLVGPEPYYLSTFINLKICDYASIFSVLKKFKENYQMRTGEIEKLAKNGKSPAVDSAVASLLAGKRSWTSVGNNVDKLPRYYYRDEILIRRARKESALRNELNIISTQNAEIKKQVSEKINEAQKSVYDRMKSLAQAELKEIKKNLQKMKIIEAEAIQRMHLNPKLAEGNGKSEGGDDVLVFPYSNEVWLDEIDNYKVSAKGCPGGKPL